MHSRTRATLLELEKADWFGNVGKEDTKAADVLPDWTSAIESCASSGWEDLLLEATNQYRERLYARNPVEFGRWNEVVLLVKSAMMELVRIKTAAVIAENDLPRVFRDTVEWDVLHACLEAEYADVYPAGFYAAQAFWYAKGHFPCGWRGAFPAGRLVIF